MNTVEVDKENLSAVVGPGVKSRELAGLLGEYGLAFPVGHCGGVAMGGFLLGGGVGINWTEWGPSCYLIKGMDIVGVDGKMRHVDDESDPDLMWLARGCGPTFPAVVTSYYLELKPEPAAVATSMHIFPADRMAEVSAWLDAERPTFRSTVEVLPVLIGAHVCRILGFDVPDNSRYIAVMVTACEENATEVERALEPFKSGPEHAAAVLSAHGTPARFSELTNLYDALFPDGIRLHADTAWTDESVSTTLGVLAEHVEKSPSERTVVLGVIPSGQPLPGDANFSMVRETLVVLYAFHEEEHEDEANRKWVEEGMRLLAPYTQGHWLGESDLTADPWRVRRSFAPRNWDRARKIRAAYDPEGKFVDYVSA